MRYTITAVIALIAASAHGQPGGASIREESRQRVEAAQSAEAGNPFREEIEAREDRELWERLIEERGTAARHSDAAFECAALAVRFDHDEHFRLLNFGYAQGQAFMDGFVAATGAALVPGLESDLLAQAMEKTSFGGWKEWVAFQLGQLYGKHEERFFREIPFGDSPESWRAAHKREYDSRNCGLIGK